MNEPDMYSLIQFIQEKADEAERRENDCRESCYGPGVMRYEGMKDAYNLVLSKIFSMRINQRPHIAYQHQINWIW